MPGGRSPRLSTGIARDEGGRSSASLEFGRLTAAAAPQSGETTLQIVTPPLANTAGYDRLGGKEVNHA
jgi:hypothetical protein